MLNSTVSNNFQTEDRTLTLLLLHNKTTTFLDRQLINAHTTRRGHRHSNDYCHCEHYTALKKQRGEHSQKPVPAGQDR